jgi:hypothetical protein
MSRESRQLSPLEELGARVSIEYADCSIAAAEAYRAAHQEIRTNRKNNEKGRLYPISADLDPLSSQSGELKDLLKTLQYKGEPVELQLFERTTTELIERPRSGILNKVVKIRESAASTLAVTKTDLQLIARIGEDTYLPLASFALQEGSENCAYVQIGPEMRDETVVMTSLDENTSRHEIVEAIRALLAERVHMDDHSIKSPKTNRIMQRLLELLIDAHPERVDRATELMLVRRAFERLHSQTVGKKFNVLTNDGSTYSETMHFVPLMEKARMEDDRQIDLCLAEPFKQGKGDDYLHLFAVARGNIALPIARMHRTTGSIVFENGADMSKEQRRTAVEFLLARTRGLPITNSKDFVTPEDYALRKSNSANEIHPDWKKTKQANLNYYDTVSATYFYEMGLLRKDEGALKEGKYDSSGMTQWGVDNLYAEFDAYFDDPENTPLPNAELAPVKLAMSRLPLKRRVEQSFFNMLNVDSTLSKVFGECFTEEERLAARVATMAQSARIFEGVFKKVQTPNTVGDITVRVTVQNGATQYEVNIYAKPQAMTNRNFPPYPQMRLTFDAAGKVIEREDGIDVNGEARKYYEILSGLKPVNGATFKA